MGLRAGQEEQLLWVRPLQTALSGSPERRARGRKRKPGGAQKGLAQGVRAGEQSSLEATQLSLASKTTTLSP